MLVDNQTKFSTILDQRKIQNPRMEKCKFKSTLTSHETILFYGAE